MKKIALYHNLPSGGARRAMVNMVEGLVSRGYIVDEYCPETADLSFLPLDAYVRKTTVILFNPLGVFRKQIPMLTPYITAARLSRDLNMLAELGRRTAQFINHQDYDLVFTHDCQYVLFPDILRFLHTKSLHYCHAATHQSLRVQTMNNDQSRTRLLGKVKSLYYSPARQVYPYLRYRQAYRNLNAAQQVLTNSNFAAAELKKATAIKAQVCYLGVDPIQFRPLGLPRDRFVLSVGAVHYHKGYRFLIRSLAQFPEKKRPALVIAANNSDPAEMGILRGLAAEKKVNFTVRKINDGDEMVKLYNRAAAFVYCPIREPWGLAAVEAMACGTPVVAVGEGGVAESVVNGETGLLTIRDEKLFADALKQVLFNPELAARLGSGGVARVRSHFTWEKTVDRLETQFHELVHEHRAL